MFASVPSCKSYLHVFLACKLCDCYVYIHMQLLHTMWFVVVVFFVRDDKNNNYVVYMGILPLDIVLLCNPCADCFLCVLTSHLY